MGSLDDRFNKSGFSRFMNSLAGRISRLVAGVVLLVVGYMYRDTTLGVVVMVLSLIPLGAGVFNLCLISAMLGGSISGAKIHAKYHAG